MGNYKTSLKNVTDRLDSRPKLKKLLKFICYAFVTAIISALVTLLPFLPAKQSLRVAQESNEIAEKSNDIAEESNEKAEEAVSFTKKEYKSVERFTLVTEKQGEDVPQLFLFKSENFYSSIDDSKKVDEHSSLKIDF